MLMSLIRTYCRDVIHDEILTERYDSLGISPSYIHKDKIAHREALFTLGDEIVSHIHGRKSAGDELFPMDCTTPGCCRKLTFLVICRKRMCTLEQRRLTPRCQTYHYQRFPPSLNSIFTSPDISTGFSRSASVNSSSLRAIFLPLLKVRTAILSPVFMGDNFIGTDFPSRVGIATTRSPFLTGVSFTPACFPDAGRIRTLSSFFNIIRTMITPAINLLIR